MSATTKPNQHLSVSDTTPLLLQLADKSGIPVDDRRLRYLARRLRTAAEDSRVPYTKIKGRYYFDPADVPAVASVLGLTNPLT